eukprot:scaffold1519_cov99-Isochrysis_galbana.AAC.11
MAAQPHTHPAPPRLRPPTAGSRAPHACAPHSPHATATHHTHTHQTRDPVLILSHHGHNSRRSEAGPRRPPICVAAQFEATAAGGSAARRPGARRDSAAAAADARPHRRPCRQGCVAARPGDALRWRPLRRRVQPCRHRRTRTRRARAYCCRRSAPDTRALRERHASRALTLAGAPPRRYPLVLARLPDSPGQRGVRCHRPARCGGAVRGATPSRARCAPAMWSADRRA